MHVENLKKWLKGEYVSPPDFKESLIYIIREYDSYKNIIHAIANIDTIFMLPDGTERDFDDEEALREIEKMAMPIWNKHCEETRKRTEEMFKNLIK